MAVRISPVGRQQFFTNQGVVAAGYKLFTYLAGSATKQNTYTDSTGGVANANPLVLGTDGRTPSGLWLTDGALYKFVLAPSNDIDPPQSPVWTEDNIGTTDASLANLASTSSVSLGDALVGFKQSNAGGAMTGASARTVHQKLQEFVNVKDFGVTLDGTTDDTTAFQAAITAVQGTGVELRMGAGTAKITSVLTVTGALTLRGAGREASVIQLTSTTQNGIAINTDTGCHLEGFRITAGGGATAGAAIVFNANATQNLFSTFRDLQFSNCFNGIATVNAADWTIDNCYFSEYKNYAVLVDDQYDEDAGDSTIIASTFSTAQANGEAIHQLSSGGLKVIGNKLVGGAYGYRGVISAAAQTSILEIVGNSIENHTIAGIQMERASAGATFSNIVISGNQIAGQPNPINLNDANTGWLSDVNVTGNIIDIKSTGGTGVTITAAANAHVGGNVITSQGGTTFGIALGSGASGVVFGVNQFNGLTTNIDGSTSVTLGPPPMLLASSGVAVSCPADATEDTLATITVPARFMGKNGSIEVDATFIYTSSVNNKTMRVKFGGTNFKAVVVTTSDTCRVLCTIHNRNATNSQVGSSPAAVASDVGENAGSLPTAAVDTASASVTLLITGQKASAGETLTLSRYTVKGNHSLT